VRAAIYYHFAKFVFVQDVKQMRAAHMKAVEAYGAALAFMRPAGKGFGFLLKKALFTGS